MKVALITHYWKNSHGGGIKTYVVNLVEALKNKGIDVNVLFQEGNDPEQFSGARQEGNDPEQFLGLRNKLGFSFACYRYLKRIRPDVIHSHGAWFCLLPGVVYRKLHPCKLIHTFHSEPERRFSLPARIFFQFLINSCDSVTFVSKRLQERVVEVESYSFTKTAITYAGVRAGEVTDEEGQRFRAHFGINEDAIVLLTLGMTSITCKAEGLKLIIQAVRILRETHPKIILVATGEGKYLEEIKKFAIEMCVEKQVVFTGEVNNPLVPLKTCDLYVHTPLGEGGVSIALLEAMAMAKPIIASSRGGIPEAITDGLNGILIEPNPELIAEKIDFLLGNRDCAIRLGESAKKTVEERFTWEQAAENFVNVYESK
jgi:glycosyltransferase involved in cell wall biosynthesis